MMPNNHKHFNSLQFKRAADVMNEVRFRNRNTVKHSVKHFLKHKMKISNSYIRVSQTSRLLLGQKTHPQRGVINMFFCCG